MENRTIIVATQDENIIKQANILLDLDKKPSPQVTYDLKGEKWQFHFYLKSIEKIHKFLYEILNPFEEFEEVQEDDSNGSVKLDIKY